MKRLKAVLLAAVVTAGLPALAAAQERPDRGDRAERGQRPDGQRPDRGNFQRPDGSQRQQFDQQRQMADQQRQAADQQRQVVEQQRRFDDQRRGNFNGRPQDGRRFDGNRFDGNRQDQWRNNDRRPDFRPGGDRRGDFRPGDDRRGDYRGQQFGRGGWAGREWRQDRRYDWQGYRSANRNLFRAGRYNAPRNWGYGYRRFGIGNRIPNFFFGSEYWIADPWAYRLPPAYGPYRWVRYYNDVLLIDLNTGQVVDEIPDFFW